MAIFKLGIRIAGESPLPKRNAPPFVDRFRFKTRQGTTLVFVVDIPQQLNVRTIEQVTAGIAYRVREGLVFSGLLCVVNDQHHVPWPLREEDSISDDCEKLASSCGISVIKSEDLARLALGAREYGWSPEQTLFDLSQLGSVGSKPPGSRPVGTVQHFYTKLNVVVIELAEGAEIAIGDILVYKFHRRYYQEEIHELQQNHQDVARARRGKVGVKVALDGKEVTIGASVFAMSDESFGLGRWL
jgi:hypothetical protein